MFSGDGATRLDSHLAELPRLSSQDSMTHAKVMVDNASWDWEKTVIITYRVLLADRLQADPKWV